MNPFVKAPIHLWFTYTHIGLLNLLELCVHRLYNIPPHCPVTAYKLFSNQSVTTTPLLRPVTPYKATLTVPWHFLHPALLNYVTCYCPVIACSLHPWQPCFWLVEEWEVITSAVIIHFNLTLNWVEMTLYMEHCPHECTMEGELRVSDCRGSMWNLLTSCDSHLTSNWAEV